MEKKKLEDSLRFDISFALSKAKFNRPKTHDRTESDAYLLPMRGRGGDGAIAAVRLDFGAAAGAAAEPAEQIWRVARGGVAVT